MKILLFFTYGTSLKDWETAGFIEREAEYYKFLSKEFNIDFLFFTYGDTEDIKIAEKYFDFEVIPIYKYKKNYKNKYLNFLNSFSFPFLIRKMKFDFDILRTNQLNGSWVSIILKYMTKKPLVIRTGYDIYSFKVKEKKSLIIQKFYFYLTHVSLRCADIYLSTSMVDISNLSKNFQNYKSKIFYIPNWIHDKSENPNISTSFDQLISVGRLEAQKNYEVLIKNLEKTNYKLNLVGEGFLMEDLKRLAKTLNVEVNFLGKVDYVKLMDLLKTMKIFISTSIYEGNPKSILEALNAGCVVVANRSENIEEIIEHDLNGILFSSEDNNLAKVLDELISDPSKLAYLSNAGFEYVQQNNALSKISKLEFQLLKKLI